MTPILAIVATVAAGLFAGAALYVTLVEHPARVAAGTAFAVREFARSYPRAARMQVALAVITVLAALGAWWQIRQTGLLIGGLTLGAVVPYTISGMFPTNHRLLASDLSPESEEAARLLRRWGKLHLVRTILSVVAAAILAACVTNTVAS